MEIPDVVSVRKFREFNAHQKQELYDTLLDLAGVIEEIPKKSLRKTLSVTLAVLEYKGGEVKSLQTQLNRRAPEGSQEDESDNERLRLLDENEKLKHMLENLEDEKAAQRDKIKELTDEIFQLEKRLQDAAISAENSDKDSTDPLSELDKQEALLRNINTKNKHIKRLIREIEVLQNKNIEQSKSMIQAEKDLQQTNLKIQQLSVDITLIDSERKELKETASELNVEIARLEGNISYLEEERDKTEKELKEFITKIESKTQSYKDMLDEKNSELKKLRAKIDGEGVFSLSDSTMDENIADGSGAVQESTKMLHAIETRDRLIDRLELKIKTMAEEMMSCTNIMNQLSAEKEDERNPENPRSCCKIIEASLRAANTRCQELTEMLERSEEDNELKSKQAVDAVSTLEAFQRGDETLTKALRKTAALEEKILSRDKQINVLIMELNSMHEISYENGVLRKRLKIPDDMIITANNLAAKQRSKDKIIDRLKLKLRASEEARLQLKLEKTDLRREMLEMHQQFRQTTAEEPTMETPKVPSEIGELLPTDDSAPSAEAPSAPSAPSILYFPSAPAAPFVLTTQSGSNTCALCKERLNLSSNDSSHILVEVQTKYQEVIEENDTLRYGMYEILEKLRSYDSSSEHITIDTQMLSRLLQVLEARSPPDTPVRLQRELQFLNQRDEFLKSFLTEAMPPLTSETDEVASIKSMRHTSVLLDHDDVPSYELPNFVDSSTRPTTPNTNRHQTVVPVITIADDEPIAKTRESQEVSDQLRIYRKHYEELQIHISASEVELARSCADMVEQRAKLELDLAKQRNSYAYMREDFDKALTDAKQWELHHIQTTAELKRDLNSKDQLVDELKTELAKLKNGCLYNEDDFSAQQKSHDALLAQLAFATEQALAGKAMPELQLADICADYGIISENFQLDYVTAAEYEKQRAQLKLSTDKQQELSRKSAQLESLLEIAQDQIRSQQKMLNEITDNHINLRHLVADLQSTAGDKLLMAKMQRDLDSVQTDAANLKMERDELKQKCERHQINLNAKEATTEQLTKNFQIEFKNKELKIKFLKKSLFILREKYSKYTPLIFLTNFVFAYTKFVKESREPEETAIAERIIQQTEEIIPARLEEYGCDPDKSEHLIKIVKTETQCKLFEEQLSSLQKKHAQLQHELAEQIVNHATEHEHWQTIAALFREDVPAERSDEAGRSDNQLVQLQDVATNTDGPIPAERKLSTGATAVRKAASELVDKNMSPIGSPVKADKVEAHEIATQTTEETVAKMVAETVVGTVVETVIGTVVAMENAQQPQPAGKEKQTAEALIQTCLQNVEDQAVQTIDLVPEESERLEHSVSAANQLEEARQKTDEHETILQRSQDALLAAHNRIEELEVLVETFKADMKNTSHSSEEKLADQQDLSQTTDIIEKTIFSFHTLLAEKDKSISKYQDLLQSEREQSQTGLIKLNADIESLKATVGNLNFNIKTKDIEIFDLKTSLETMSLRRNSQEKLDLATNADGGDNSLNELTDEKIEEMFQQDGAIVAEQAVPTLPIITLATDADNGEEKQDSESLKELPTLVKQVKELKDNVVYLENALKVKEEEISLLKERVTIYQEREKSMETANTPDSDQTKQLLEEKDKHINDLLQTLNNFHDDQERFIEQTSNYSADQISKLATDLTRSDATNKIYHTQVEALRRQLTNLTQREKQAREVNQSLRNQLIKRPVVSIKTELNTRVKNENLQKRLQQLDLELEEARAQIQRQQAVIDTKRARSASEVSLWEKQKRFQQNAEKFKAKLEESECMLEKTRTLLQTARTTITRLEKDKQVLEAKLGRLAHGCANNMKCCRTPSCPNLHRNGGKYTPSESPEIYTGPSSECSSPTHSAPSVRRQSDHLVYAAVAEHHPHAELIQALKARIELQQRKILAMELEGKGTNALTIELDKMQERFAAIEAQNIRLEAQNLQFQLDNDLLRQGDATDRLQKRIKHLEDYIIALKEEMAHAEARREICKCAGIKLATKQEQAAEQTILSLRRIVEKLRAENKYLKDGRRSCESRSSTETNADLSRLQQMYTESLNKISTLQIELNLKAKCKNCGSRGKIETQTSDELKYIKDQLIKKAQLLQKAKVLLTRAAAKEKILKEQLALWKRKCSELQNVPVIEEISE